MTGAVQLSGAPVVLDDGAVLVPARAVPLLLATIQDAVRGGVPLHPDLRPVVEACGIAARLHRAQQARLQDLERRAASAPATPPTTAVLATTQTGPPSQVEITVRDAMGLLDLSGQRVRQLAKSGRLAGRRVGGQWWFARAVVDDYRNDRRRAA